MGIEDNKAIVRRFMDSLGTGAPDYDLLAEDVRWWIQGHGVIDRAQFQALVTRMRATKSPSTMTIRHVTAEEDRVAVECDGHGTLNDGRTYANSYHFLFIVRDGRIVETREHFDTAYAADLFRGGQNLETA